jgi:hypothetical protein
MIIVLYHTNQGLQPPQKEKAAETKRKYRRFYRYIYLFEQRSGKIPFCSIGQHGDHGFSFA